MAYEIKIYDNSNKDFVRGNDITSYTNPAPKGEIGPNGLRGTSLYFVDYDLTNDYYKELVIKKITNNIMLSSDADVKQEGREYISGDLVLASDKSMYRIKKDNDIYDIEYIGKLHDRNITEDYKDKIINIVVNISSNVGKMSTPSMRWYYSDEDEACYKTAYLTIIPKIYTLNNISNKEYDYFLRISLYNQKHFTFGDYTLKNRLFGEDEHKPLEEYNLSLTNNHMDFYKIIEIPLIEFCRDDNGTFNCIDGDDDISNYILMTEMAMDKLHPSGNNMSISPKIISYDRYRRLYIFIPQDVSNLIGNGSDYDIMSAQLQLSTRKIDNNIEVNYRSGESCYFSGICETPGVVKLQDYVNAIQSNDSLEITRSEMINFLTNDKNILELVCVNKNTGKTELVNLNNGTIKCKFVTL
jgi:hypothetical protein